MTIDRNLSVVDFLKEVTGQLRALTPFEHKPLSVLRGWSTIPSGLPFFESVVGYNGVVFDPLGAVGSRFIEQPHAPLNLFADLGRRLILRLGYDRRRFRDATVSEMLRRLRSLVEAMVRSPASKLADLPFPETARIGSVQPGKNGESAVGEGFDDEFWVARLTTARPLEVPLASRGVSRPADHYEVDVAVPVELTGADAGDNGSRRREVRLLAAILAFLARISGEEEGFDVGLRWDGPLHPQSLLDAPPLRDGMHLAELEVQVSQRLGDVAARGPCARGVRERLQSVYGARLLSCDDAPIAFERVETLGGPRDPMPALLLQLTRHGGGCRLWCAENLVPRAAGEAMGAQLTAFLRAALGDGANDLTAISLLSDADRRSVLIDANKTTAEYPRDECVHHLFMKQARRRPDAVAIVSEDASLTYAELDERSSRLASLLLSRRIGRGSLIGVYLERSTDLVVSLLAIMKSGGTYVPLDPIYPSGRLSYMLSDARVVLLITHSGLEPNVRAAGVRTILLDRSHDDLAAASADPPSDGATAEDLAYVIYTSGSTGRPKGVEIGHRSLTNVLCAMARSPGFAEDDRLLAVTTIGFDIAGLELLLPLVMGGQVEVAAANVAANGFSLRERLDQSRPSVMQATPATWRMLVEVGWTGDPNLKVFCGGEALPPDLARDLAMRAREVWNLYGPTETTIWAR